MAIRKTAGIKTLLGAGENFIGTVGGNAAFPGINITRPDNTDGYEANDVINGTVAEIFELTTAARADGKAEYAINALIAIKVSDAAAWVTKNFRLHIFNQAPDPIADG